MITRAVCVEKCMHGSRGGFKVIWALPRTSNQSYLLRKIIAPRGIKLGIFRALKLGFSPAYPKIGGVLQKTDFLSLLANIFLNDIENLHTSVRFGYDFLCFLRPEDNENLILNRISKFLYTKGLKFLKDKACVFSLHIGFDFLGWHFNLKNNNDINCIPAFDSYQKFLKRVKSIVNNSNYGAVWYSNYKKYVF